MQETTENSTKYLSADERRNVTVEAVVTLAGDRNPTDITTAAIAQHMGLTQGAIFRHFPNKDSIIQSVIDWVRERLMQRVDRAAELQTSPLAALEAVFLAHITFISAHPGAPRVLLSEMQKAGDSLSKRMVLNLQQAYRERIVTLLQRGKECDEVDPTLDVESASILYIGMVQGLVMQTLVTGSPALLLQAAPRVFAVYRKSLRSVS